ncbi:MAG TPA: universal stress protein [Polyangia bacterium]|jgi:nucleotide-binding universal stress UspA family protein|nr:universal stress protein [Polyangia bacterium]
MIASILAALDESPRAALVFERATELARRLPARLVLMRVVWVPADIPPAAHVAASGVEGSVERFVEASARDELRRLMETAREVAFGEPVVVEGDPWRQILIISKQLDVDLIVMGNHRYHGLERMLGTVAAKVVNHAHCDVLVVRGAPSAADGA